MIVNFKSINNLHSICNNTNKEQYKDIVQKSGLNQEQLTNKVGMSKANVSSYEKGKNIPPLDVIIELCQLFEVSIDDLVFKNLAKEEGEGWVEPAKEKNPNTQLLIQMLVIKIKEISRGIEERDPERYKEMELEEILKVIEEY